MAVATSVTILFAVLVLPILHESLEGERDYRRRAMLMSSLLMTLAIVVPPLWKPLKGFVLADDAKMEVRCVCTWLVFRFLHTSDLLLNVVRNNYEVFQGGKKD